MAALFTAASTQYLINSAPPVLDYPFSIGMWANLAAVGGSARTLFALSDTGTTNNYLLVRMTSTELISIVGRAGGTENTASTGTAMPAGGWVFFVAGFISSTARRLFALFPDGIFDAALGSTARAPTGMDTLTIGALSTSGGITEPWDGLIGEFWLANTYVWPDSAAAMTNQVVRQFAYGGPFSVPYMTKDIVEYRSFRQSPVSDTDNLNEVFHGAKGRQIWTNTNGVTTSHHPPLPYWYVKPGQTQRVLTI